MSVFNELSGPETENSLKLTFKTGIKILALEKLLQHDRRSVTWHILYPCFHSPLMAGVNADGMTAKHDDDDDSNLSSQVFCPVVKFQLGLTEDKRSPVEQAPTNVNESSIRAE